MKRAELRIIQMTEDEYERAMEQFYGKEYLEEDSYYGFSRYGHTATHMYDFSEDLDKMMEIANTDDLHTLYVAWKVEKDGKVMRTKSEKAIIPLYELPESFDPDKFEFDNIPINVDYEEKEETLC